jgi:hypothetical protein
MELLRSNYAQTSTQFVVGDNTATAENLLFRDIRYQYYTVSSADDSLTASIRINFDETLTVDRIAILGHNLRDFTVYYNGVTANTFSLDSFQDTTTSHFASNSATSTYLRCTPVDCTSVSIDMRKTITAGQNKYIGYLVVTEKLTDFDGRVPSAQKYDPMLTPTQTKHQTADGGIRLHTIDEKWITQIGFDALEQSTRDDLLEIWQNKEEMIFARFGTTTGWDGHMYPCVWSGGFNFYKYTDNAVDAGFSGSLTLEETPK